MKRILSICLAVFLVLPMLASVAEQEPLPPDQVFHFSAKATDANTIEAQWTLPDGYYIYHDKIHFRSETAGITLGQPQLPKGHIKQDPTFGKVEIHRGTVTIRVPVQRSAGAGDTLKLQAMTQGCADMGLCYPPYTTVAQVQLPAAAPATDATAKGGAVKAISKLGDSLGLQDAGDEFLPVDQAFALSTQVQPDGTIIASWKVTKSYYLYRDKFHFKLENAPPGVALGEAVLPPGDAKDDPSFGRVYVFHHDVSAKVPVTGPAGGKDLKLQVRYQGCAEAGLCYPPVTKTVSLKMPAGAGGGGAAPAQQAQATASANSSPPASASEAPAVGQDRFSQILAHGSITAVVLAALGFGILLAFTACMYPMIPILSSIIVGQGEKVSAAKGFGLSLLYVESLALTFGVIGVIMGLFGGGIGIQAAFQTPWALIPFALLFVVLAFSMFGFFNIQMPSAIQSRLNAFSNRQKGGTLIGVSVMGILSALIIGPCGGPVLIAALAYAASSGSALHGFLALFALGNGMGLPLLLVGAAGGALLPRAGDWMNTVKAVAGVILLAVAIAFLERIPTIFPPSLTMLLWATLFIVSAIYMGALSHLGIDASGWRKLWKGLGLTALIYGVVVMLGGLTGGANVADPLHGSQLLAGSGSYQGVAAGTQAGAGSATNNHGPEFKRIKTVADLQREVAAANAAGKTAMLDFYADWCTYCVQFERYVFPDPGVRSALSNTVLLQADVTATDAQDKALMEHVGVFLPPAILFFNRDGKEERKYRVIGYMKADLFAQRVRDAFQGKQ